MDKYNIEVIRLSSLLTGYYGTKNGQRYTKLYFKVNTLLRKHTELKILKNK